MFRRCIINNGKVLVVGEIQGGKITPGTFSAITAASKCGDVSMLLSGVGAKDLAKEAAKVKDLKEIFVSEAEHYAHGLPEEVSPFIVENAKAGSFTHIVGATSAFIKNALPRVAAALDSMPISDVTEIKDENSFVRQAYAGNVISTVTSADTVKILTIRPTSFDRAAGEGGSAEVKDAKDTPKKESSKWVEDVVAKTDKPDLATANVVISGGRGLKNGDNFKLLDELAAPLKAAVGATRAVVDAGYCPNEMQVGQTGKIVAPGLYIAIGLSGAIQHIAGMKDSKVIACINTDEDAPIFCVSDYGLKADLFDAVPKLTEMVKQ